MTKGGEKILNVVANITKKVAFTSNSTAPFYRKLVFYNED